MATAETNILNRCLVGLCAAVGGLWFRNNTGQLPDKNGRMIKFGLCVGGSDIIGGTPVTITPDMVGQTLLVFTAVEVKTPTGRVSPAQTAFIAAVRRHGGRAGVARSVDDALAIAFPPPG